MTILYIYLTGLFISWLIFEFDEAPVIKNWEEEK